MSPNPMNLQQEEMAMERQRSGKLKVTLHSDLRELAWRLNTVQGYPEVRSRDNNSFSLGKFLVTC